MCVFAFVALCLCFRVCLRSFVDSCLYFCLCVFCIAVFSTILDGFGPVLDPFGLTTNFNINVGLVNIIVFLKLQTVLDLF